MKTVRVDLGYIASRMCERDRSDFRITFARVMTDLDDTHTQIAGRFGQGMCEDCRRLWLSQLVLPKVGA